MHDIDRTQLEIGDQEFESEYEFEDEFESETYDETEAESAFSEDEEMELAAELLEVNDEYELDQFLGKLFRRARRAVGRIVPPSVMRTVGGYLKGAVKRALPGVARRVGMAIGGPAGGAIAGRLAPLAGRFFGLELEGLSAEDQEYEVARRMVRFAGAAAQQAAMTPAAGSAQTVAQSAVASAAKRHAPGFLRGSAASSSVLSPSRGRSGKWVRRGRKIVILGV
jgi:hypothetical protein